MTRTVHALPTVTETQNPPRNYHLRTWEKIGLGLGIFSIMMPIAFQSLLGGCILIWFFTSKQWKDARTSIFRRPFGQGLDPALAFLLKIIAIAATIQITLLITHEIGTPAFANRLKLMGKQGIYGLLIMMIYSLSKKRGLALHEIAPMILTLMLGITAYNVFQRYFGIDWTNGFGNHLGDNRFAYGVYRVAGFMSHPITFAYNCVIFYALSLTLAFTSHAHKEERIIWLTCAILAFVNLIFSSTRWAIFIGLLVSFAFSIIYLRKRWGRMLPFAFGIVLALVATTLLNHQISGRFTEIFTDFDTQTIYQKIPRFAFWKVHWQMFLDAPFFGHGLENIKEITTTYYNQMGFANFERKYSAHNIYLQTLADSGILGLSGLLTILFGGYFTAQKLKTNEAVLARAWQALILAVALLGLMQNNLRDSEHVMALWIALAVILARKKERSNSICSF